MADHKDYWVTEGDQGTIKISEDVVASIAALSAAETDGVSSLYSSLTSELVGLLGSRKNLGKGVKVQLGENDTVSIDICFLVKFGYNICDTARNVQLAVRSAIESMTGLKTACINIHVGGIAFDSVADAADSAPEASAEIVAVQAPEIPAD